MMEYVIGGIVIVILIYIAGYLMKKKLYKEVDRLETWKLDITNRPVLDEMSKVKRLNMIGQTEELFERWRNEWDEIVTVKLPNVEEFLFDAEEYIDKYRFSKAKEKQLFIDKLLAEIEGEIKALLKELNDLVGSEEKNRLEIEELKRMYRERKKQLLAHRHSFGKAEALLEQELSLVAEKFTEYEEKTEQGNYLEARETVMLINEMLHQLELKMEAIPNLLTDCQTKLPTQLADLKEGYAEMLAQGYILEHIQLEKEIEQYDKDLVILLEAVNKAEIEEVQQKVSELKDAIEFCYDVLEKEAIAKQYIYQHEKTVRDQFFTAKEKNYDLKDELEQISESYHLQEGDIETQHMLEKALMSLEKRYGYIEQKIIAQKTAYTHIMDDLIVIKDELEQIKMNQEVYSEKLQALRKDEMDAHEQIKLLKKQIADTIRLISKSNVPGLSDEYKLLMEEAKESIQQVVTRLEEKPLNISTVRQYLEIAVLSVEKAVNSTEEIVETIALAERVIQYGNRYRSSYTSIEKGLQEAEKAFHTYEYKHALEQAASAIEEVEPGAMKKIEKMLVKEH